MHYVIGDVHGNYKTLLTLIDKLPKNAQPIFVGDLIDRGPQSAEVVALVRDLDYKCVMGNHEELMFTYGSLVVDAYRNNTRLDIGNFWCMNGGIEALRSYGLVDIAEGQIHKVKDFEKNLQRFENDMMWMQGLETYLELQLSHPSALPVVVSHAPIGSVWELRKIDSMFATFHKTATTSRRNPDANVQIFNIFGHTPQAFGADKGVNYVNIDTGCYKKEYGYNTLSAYCIESGEVISVQNCDA